jgi:hypothetical protein
MTTHHVPRTSDLKVAFVGLTIGLIWIAIVGTFAHFLALGGASEEVEHTEEMHAPPA